MLLHLQASEYSTLLGVDASLRATWDSLLARMPPYPTQTFTFVKNQSAIVVGSDLSGVELLVEVCAFLCPYARI